MKARMKRKVRAMAKVIAKAKEQANAEKRLKAMGENNDAYEIYDIGEETETETEAEMSTVTDVKEKNEPIKSEAEPKAKEDEIRQVITDEEISKCERETRKTQQVQQENVKVEAENKSKITPKVQQTEKPTVKRQEQATGKRKVSFAEKVQMKVVSPTAKAEAEAKARARAQAKLKAQVLARAKANLEAAAKLKAEAMARAKAAAVAKMEALKRAKEEAEAIRRMSQRAKEKAEARKQLEARAKEAAESVEPHVLRRAAEAVLKAKAKALANAQAKVQAKAKVLATAKARSNSKAKLVEVNPQPKGEEKTKTEAKPKEEGKPKIEAKSKDEQKIKMEEKSKDELKGRVEAKTKPKDEVKQKEEPKPKNESKAKEEMKTKPESKLKTVPGPPKGKIEQKGREKAKPTPVMQVKVTPKKTVKPKEGEEADAKNDSNADEAIARAMVALQKAGALAKARAQVRAESLAKADAEAKSKANAEAEGKTKADTEAKANFHERAMNFIRTKPNPLSCLMAIMEEPDHEGADEKFYTEPAECISLGTAQVPEKPRGRGAGENLKEQQASVETAEGDRNSEEEEGAEREDRETPHIALSLCDGRDHWPLDISQWHVSDEGQLVLSCSISRMDTAAAAATPTPTPTPSAGKQPVNFTVNGASDRIRAVSNHLGQTLAPTFTSRYITSPIVIAPPVLAALPTTQTSLLTPSPNPALLLAVTSPEPTATAVQPSLPPRPPPYARTRVALTTVPVASQPPAQPPSQQPPAPPVAIPPSVPKLSTQGTMTDAPVPEEENHQITAEVEQQTSELFFAVYDNNPNPPNPCNKEAQFPFAQVQQSKVSEWAKLTRENTENAQESVTFSRNLHSSTSSPFHNQHPTNNFLDINQRSSPITFDNLSTFVNLSKNSNIHYQPHSNTITFNQKSTTGIDKSLHQSSVTFGGQQTALSKFYNNQQMSDENLHKHCHIPSGNLKLNIDEMNNLQQTTRSNFQDIEEAMSHKFDKQKFPPIEVKNAGQPFTLNEAQLPNPLRHSSQNLKYHQARDSNNFGLENSFQMNNSRHITRIDDTTSNTLKYQFPHIKVNNAQHTTPFSFNSLQLPTSCPFKQLQDFTPNLVSVKQTNSNTFNSQNSCPLNLPLTRSYASMATPRNVIAFQNLTHKMAKSNSKTIAYAFEISQNAK